MAAIEKINSKMVGVTINPGEQIMSRRGAMLAYTGQVAFEPMGPTGMGGVGGFVGRVVGGESVPLMVSTGQGHVLYGHEGLYVSVIDVGNESLQVEADRLLLFEGTLQAGTVMLSQQGGIRALAQGAVTGQGLATTQLSGFGSAVVLSHGPVIEVPVTGRQLAIDPQAYVGHKGAIETKLDANVSWRDAVGRGSGEAFQLKLTGTGVAYLQPSEVKI